MRTICRVLLREASWRVVLTALAVIWLLPLRVGAAFDPPTVTAVTFLERKELTIALGAIVLIETALVVALVTMGRKRQASLDGGERLATAPRRDAEPGLHELSRRLIVAQEEERRRIARELHDHLNQQLALLAIDLQQLAMSNASAALSTRLDELWQRTNEISSEVHGLSHRLHPSKLEALGLVATIRGHCRDISRQGVVAHFSERKVPSGIPADVSLCLFRIVEEALSNVVRHSQAAEAFVTLEEIDREIVLSIADGGRGFECAVTPEQAGLGLVSMRERLYSVGGTLKVASAPGKGARIEARVPRDAAATTAFEPQIVLSRLTAVH